MHNAWGLACLPEWLWIDAWIILFPLTSGYLPQLVKLLNANCAYCVATARPDSIMASFIDFHVSMKVSHHNLASSVRLVVTVTKSHHYDTSTRMVHLSPHNCHQYLGAGIIWLSKGWEGSAPGISAGVCTTSGTAAIFHTVDLTHSLFLYWYHLKFRDCGWGHRLTSAWYKCIWCTKAQAHYVPLSIMVHTKTTAVWIMLIFGGMTLHSISKAQQISK